MQRKYLFSESSLSTSFSFGCRYGYSYSDSYSYSYITFRLHSLAYNSAVFGGFSTWCTTRRTASQANRRMFISLRPHNAGRRTVGHLRPQSNGSTQRYLAPLAHPAHPAPHTCLFCALWLSQDLTEFFLFAVKKPRGTDGNLAVRLPNNLTFHSVMRCTLPDTLHNT